MRFPTLILKNLLRRKTRSSLTTIGISIGIATIVALGALMSGMKSGMEGILKSGEADFSVAQSGVSDLQFSKIAEDRVEEIEALEGVKKAVGAFMTFYPVEGNPYTITWGVNREDLSMFGVNIVNGSSFSQEYELIIGEVLSKDVGKAVGDKLVLGQEEFNITGVFETGSLYHDRGLALSLKKLQEMEKKEGYVMIVYVELEEGANIEEVCHRIEEGYPDLVTIKSVAELGKVDKGLEVLDAVNLAVSFLAILIGGIGVTNTMIMSIYERTREIGVLRAVGWKRKRVLSMILGESMLLCLFSVPIGSLLGFFGVRLLLLHPIVGGLLEPIFTLDTFVRAFVVAFAVGLVGGFYPAYRASKLSPGEALRYE